MKMNEKKFKHLTEEQRKVLLEKRTEMPGTGKLLHEKGKGIYKCVACGNLLYKSDSKFDSGTGWPSFDNAIPGAVELKEDNSFGMKRIEVVCAKCGGHLGHMFDDGPKKTTGKRHCINSVCLNFDKE